MHIQVRVIVLEKLEKRFGVSATMVNLDFASKGPQPKLLQVLLPKLRRRILNHHLFLALLKLRYVYASSSSASLFRLLLIDRFQPDNEEYWLFCRLQVRRPYDRWEKH